MKVQGIPSIYSDSCKNVYKSSVLPNFNLNINRNVILPLVFGGIIILFSLLLFNFVNIKNPLATEKIERPNPIINQPVPEKIVKTIPVDTSSAIEDFKKDSTLNTTVTASISIPTPTLQTNTVVAIPTNTLAAKTPSTPTTPTLITQNNIEAGTWLSFSDDPIYESPNIASKIIGHSVKNQSYKPIEETKYFIKIVYKESGEVGYLQKSQAQKNYGQNSGSNNSSASSGSGKRKNRKAEAMESIAVPSLLPSNSGTEEKEPELK